MTATVLSPVATRGGLKQTILTAYRRICASLPGDRSIRGYKYKSIAPKDDDGKLIGASKMATGSLEYQYNVTGKWWGAVFVDSGEAVSDIRRSDFKTGTGVGVRWQSPVGPIKFDLAVPVGDKDEHGLQFYIGLGPEL